MRESLHIVRQIYARSLALRGVSPPALRCALQQFEITPHRLTLCLLMIHTQAFVLQRRRKTEREVPLSSSHDALDEEPTSSPRVRAPSPTIFVDPALAEAVAVVTAGMKKQVIVHTYTYICGYGAVEYRSYPTHPPSNK